MEAENVSETQYFFKNQNTNKVKRKKNVSVGRVNCYSRSFGFPK
jgi:hypothetical protein